jgi:hypothetical protein
MGNTSVSSARYNKVQHYAVITQNLLKQYFPDLARIPDIVYIAMAIWGHESSFNMSWSNTKFWGENSGLNGSSSIHPGVTPSNFGSLIPQYMNSPAIRSLISNGSTPSQVLININQGRAAHGASGVMGCYCVKNTGPNIDMFGHSYYRKVITDLGLEVNPGESIIALFPDNDTGLTRSIAAGLLVLDSKYKIYRRHKRSVHDSIVAATIAYVGRGADINGYIASNRAIDVNSKTDGIAILLANSNITKSGLDAFNQVANYSDSLKPVEADSKQTTVAATNSTPKGTIGCS